VVSSRIAMMTAAAVAVRRCLRWLRFLQNGNRNWNSRESLYEGFASLSYDVDRVYSQSKAAMCPESVQ
jgi:hypothetical protein